MSTIKFHVENEELAAIQRRADALGIKVSDLAYGALNCTMNHANEAYCVGRIKQSIDERGGDLPRWSDSAPSVGAYEGKSDIEPERGPKAIS